VNGSGGVVRILSDLHLGHPATQVREVAWLAPLLEGAAEVWFNGDTFEEHGSESAERGRVQYQELLALCDAHGVRPRFLTGNHDPGIAAEGWVEMRSGRVFVSHGDMILAEVAPWKPEFLERRGAVRQLIREFGEVESLERLWRRARLVEAATLPDVEPKMGVGGRGYLWSAFWPPMRPFHILHGWATMFREAERFVERYRPGCEVFLFGHFHRPGVRERGGRIYCNTGAFMRSATPLMVELEGDWMRVRGVHRDRNGNFCPTHALESFRIPS
jgi:predicted phosphodiesterase